MGRPAAKGKAGIHRAFYPDARDSPAPLCCPSPRRDLGPNDSAGVPLPRKGRGQGRGPARGRPIRVRVGSATGQIDPDPPVAQAAALMTPTLSLPLPGGGNASAGVVCAFGAFAGAAAPNLPAPCLMRLFQKLLRIFWTRLRLPTPPPRPTTDHARYHRWLGGEAGWAGGAGNPRTRIWSRAKNSRGGGVGGGARPKDAKQLLEQAHEARS